MGGHRNSVEVAALVKKELAKIEAVYSANNLKFEIAQDGSLFTIDAANAVKDMLNARNKETSKALGE